ncbi:MAG: lamin tail domain-containing protein [Chthoniobacterales bacterium]
MITEFLADNKAGLSDEDGEKSDWIEIRNPNAFAVTLNGWKLSDSGATWVFPDMQIEPGEYLLVFASGKNRRDPAAPLHTNFKLDADGESLALRRPDGTFASAFAYPAQRTDISCFVDTNGVAAFFPTPTPGAVNGASVEGFVEVPAFSVTRGFFTTTQSVAITSVTPGATIRYTTNKSTPTETNGNIYTGPLTVSATTVVRACAFKTNMLTSASVTQTYLFLNDVLNQVYATNTAPSGWPVDGATTLNGQEMRYGFNSSVMSKYTTQQLIDGLRQIPTISIVTDQANLTGKTTGIYSNAFGEGIDWERPASAEYIKADGTPGFQINCGLRLRGGYSRNAGYPKHGFRLFFRSAYGKGSLSFPLHTSGTTDFESIDLRTEENYHYANDFTGSQNTAVHEVFSRDLQALVGKPTTHSSAVQLYVNGQYWGLYQTEERPQQDYGATYFGGTSDDYDAVQTAGASNNYYFEMSNGTVDAWQQTWTLARTCASNPSNENYFKILGCNEAGVRDPALPVYIDPASLAGTMLLYYYIGDGDAVLSAFLGGVRANNWKGLRRRGNDQAWAFFLHDSEHTVQRGSWRDQRVGAYISQLSDSNRSNFLYSNPEWIFEDLAANPEFRIKIADVAQKYFLNAGPLSGPLPLVDFNARAAEIDKAIIPDMARWGQTSSVQTYSGWQAQLTGIRTNFIPGRAASIINQLKARGFYPGVSPPTFSQRGGRVASGYQLTLSAPGQTGTIYVTTDGSDPRAVGGAAAGQAYIAPIPITSAVQVRTRFRSSVGEWSALDEAGFAIAPPAAAGSLVVSKFDYHPVDATTAETAAGYTGTDFEYIELMNISADAVDLRDVQITGGVTFSFASSTFRTLAPGARVLVVGNVAGFELRHGTGLPVAGAYSGNLSNGGELVRVAGSGGQIVQFTYDDAAPWPAEADGNGYALVLKNPNSNPDPNVAANWRATHQPGGQPGAEDPSRVVVWRNANFSVSDLADASKETDVWGDGADPDHDGLPNLMEFALGGDPNAGATAGRPVVDAAAGKLMLTYVRSKVALEEVALSAVCADDAGGPWAGAGVTEEILSDNGTTQTVRASVDASGARKFLRLRVTRL